MWYQEDNVQYQVCSSTNGEDPACQDSLPIAFDPADHTKYLNVDMGC